MQVHERYYGRTLKCTGCRTEFVAEAREEDLAPPPAEAVPRTPARGAGGPKWILWLVLLLVPVIGFVLWLGRGGGPPETAFREQHAVGDVAALVDMRTGAVQLGI
jgi:hypothetical protein